MARRSGGPLLLMARWQMLAGLLLALGLAITLVRQALDARARSRAAPGLLFGKAADLLERPEIAQGGTIGSCLLTGRYDGHFVQVKTVIDTLAVRKLPSLWLMVTLPELLPVVATFDLMMRPAGPVTFSNFDQLAHTLPHPAGFPGDAVIHSDDPMHVLDTTVVAGHLKALFGAAGKELLITPKGLRMVSLLAEADRVRYGVFRQAAFGEVQLDPEVLRGIIVTLLALQTDIKSRHG